MYLERIDHLIPDLEERGPESAAEKIRRSLMDAARKAAFDLLEREYQKFVQELAARSH